MRITLLGEPLRRLPFLFHRCSLSLSAELFQD